MRKYLRTFAKVGIALFVAWHVVAIGAYTVPGEAKGPVARWIRENVQPRVVRYVLITSQWQQWNLFSPNPLRRIIYYRVETQNAIGQWSYVASVNNNTYGVWRRAVRFKLLGQALEEDTKRPELAERAAQVFCREFGFDPGERIRIWRDLTIVPYVVPYPGKEWWDEWTPRFTSTLAHETACI
jgi:hypothetical protein